MPNELKLKLPPVLTGLTVTANTILGTTTTSTGNACPEVAGTPGYYVGNMPSGQVAGDYTVPFLFSGVDSGYAGRLAWDGTKEVTLASLAGQLVTISTEIAAEQPVPGLTAVDQNYGGSNALQYTDPLGNGVAGATVQIFTQDAYQRSTDPVPPASWAVGNTTTIVNGAWADQIWLGPGTYVVQFSFSGLYAPTTAHIIVGNPTTNPITGQPNGGDWLV